MKSVSYILSGGGGLSAIFFRGEAIRYFYAEDQNQRYPTFDGKQDMNDIWYESFDTGTTYVGLNHMTSDWVTSYRPFEISYIYGQKNISRRRFVNLKRFKKLQSMR